MPKIKKFFNRELSWIEFNARVLKEALRKDIPLFERLNFLSIVSSNFDEFFQVRVASIKHALEEDAQIKDSCGYTPKTLLKAISSRCHQLNNIHTTTLMNDILPALAEEGLEYVSKENFSDTQQNFVQSHFHHDIYPLLTPLRTDGEQFPNIPNMTLHAAFLLERIPGVHKMSNELSPEEDNELLAIVPLPSKLKNIIWLPTEQGDSEKKHAFTLLEDIVPQYGTELFSGYNIKETLIFKVNRDADFSVNEDFSSDFIKAMEEVIIKRQSSFAVRIVCTSSSSKILSILKEKLSITDDDVYKTNGILDIETLTQLFDIEDKEKLLYPAWPHFSSNEFPEEGKYWQTLCTKDVLLTVPYQSYDYVVKFIQDAASDKDVLAIKMTLYRTGSNSPIVQALKKAAMNGKAVTVFVELKARFDEKLNISWVKELENAGATVIWGLVNLKVHAKICLIIRKEKDGIKRYTHLSTGNYNPKTAKLYQDFSIFTSNSEIAFDATLFFNVISGYSIIQNTRRLSIAPVNLKEKLLEMIDREAAQSTPDNPGLIIAKMNSLCHEEIIERLYKASCAGVKIMLNVRGICTLRPGVKGLSENIEVTSIIDRYLEHSRVFYFKNGSNEELYLSSADWMPRNLEKRIELMFPILDKDVFESVKSMLMIYFKDNTHSHKLFTDGTWKPVQKKAREKNFRAQEEFYNLFKKTQKTNTEAQILVRRKN